jgi:glutamate formiminotransferase/formiminotetrahydrofolate cyclodeaminase
MKQLIECVPNFSEGRDRAVLKQITDQIETVEGVRLLDIDPGEATNRTVVTFAGTPDEVVEAAFRAIKKASEVIDMRKHKGAHPRFGATDVCPLVPIASITMEETIVYAHKLAKRVGEELGIPVYCYEYAATKAERRNLANCRAGEYEGLKDKLADPNWKPDYGPATFNAQSGATAVGARNFLVAYNVNLNTTSTRRANAIAFDIREQGRVVKPDDPQAANGIPENDGEKVRVPGTLKKVKAIGWFIKEYGIAQISINLTDITVTPIHVAFDEVCRRADERGVRVTGSEIVGLVPLQAMLDAGKHYLRRQQRSLGIPDREIIRIAVKSLGLNELYPFDPRKKIIEYILEDNSKNRLVDMSLKDFVYETASESPAPGGGSVSAYIGSLGVALGTMVANLSAHKRGWDDRWEEFSGWAEKGKHYHDELLKMVDEDTDAFNRIMAAFDLPKGNDQEKNERKKAIEEATKAAIEVPFKTMHLCYESMQVMKAMAESGSPASVSDAGVGALAAVAAAKGAFLNVRINAANLEDKTFAEEKLSEGTRIIDEAGKLEEEILAITLSKINR